ncbi:MAG TPA: hypothetical protein VF221_15465 [Chloroflexota bacterium]
MSGLMLPRGLRALLVFGACALGAAAQPAAAQSVGPSPAPANVDTARPTVSGTLVAKPIGGEGNIPVACRDRDASAVNAATMQRRGLVVCTEEGRLVLLQLTRSTGIYARYWGRFGVGRLTDGDHINAWGVLKDNGYVLDPSYAVQDTDIQEAFVDSQDFIARRGGVLTLYVLKSDANGPVQGVVRARRGGVTHITLCNGAPGIWADLTAGKTIDITRSLFNRRLETYIHTDTVRVVSCP